MIKDFIGKKILVIGGAGFVGSNLVRRLLELSPRQIVIIDNLLSAERLNIPFTTEIDFIEGSITNDAILSRLQDDLDYIFHLATFHGNQNSIFNPLADHENNTITTLKLYERIKSFQNIIKVVYSGAGCAVAEKTFDKAHATQEDAPISLHMDSPYSISKIVGEFYSAYYHHQHGLPVVRARFQNVYGPGEILGAGQWRGTPATVWRNVTPTFIYKAIKGKTIPIEGDGKATRDFIYVGDIVNGLIACATKGQPGEVYNLASGEETSIHQLALLINDLTGNSSPIEWHPRRDWDRSGRRFGSPKKAKRELGFETQVKLRDGLMNTIVWTRQNLEMIENCMQKHAVYIKFY